MQLMKYTCCPGHVVLTEKRKQATSLKSVNKLKSRGFIRLFEVVMVRQIRYTILLFYFAHKPSTLRCSNCYNDESFHLSFAESLRVNETRENCG